MCGAWLLLQMRIGSRLLGELLARLLARVLAIAGCLRARDLGGGRRRRASGAVVLALLRDDGAWLEGLIVERLRAGLGTEAAVLEARLEGRVGLLLEVEVLLGVGEAGGVVCVELVGVNLGRGALRKHVGVGRRLPLIHDAIMRLRAMEEVSGVTDTRSRSERRVGGWDARARQAREGTCWMRAVRT